MSALVQSCKHFNYLFIVHTSLVMLRYARGQNVKCLKSGELRSFALKHLGSKGLIRSVATPAILTLTPVFDLIYPTSCCRACWDFGYLLVLQC